MNRDKVFDLIVTLWNKTKGEQSLGINLKKLIKQELEASKPQPDTSSIQDKANIISTDPLESEKTFAQTTNVNNNENTSLSPPTDHPLAVGNLSSASTEIHHDFINLHQSNPNFRAYPVDPHFQQTTSIYESAGNILPGPKSGAGFRDSQALYIGNNANGEDRPLNSSSTVWTRNKPLDLAVLHNKEKIKLKKSDQTEIPQNLIKEMLNEQEKKKRKKEEKSSESQTEKTSENDKSNEGEENTIDKEELENEEKEEKEEEEIDDTKYPTGVFPDHIVIQNEPCIDEFFPSVTPKEFYKLLIYDNNFWEHIFVVTDSTAVTIPIFEQSDTHKSCLDRICTFTTPIKGAPMGPKQTRVKQTHRVSFPTPE